MRYILSLALLLSLIAAATPAAAEVELAFYAREGDGRTFSHAFVTMRGDLGPEHLPIDRSVGFSAVRVSMAIVARPVPGMLLREPRAQIARSKRYFAVRLTDARYRAVDAAIRRWQAAPQPSYNLERRNCVHFVAAVARASGLRVPSATAYWRDPSAFVGALRATNARRAEQR